MANLIGSYMEKHGIRFQRGYVPTKLERIEEGTPGRIKVMISYMALLKIYFVIDDFKMEKVTSQNEQGELMEEEYNTVLFAIGRDACTNKIGIEKANVMLNSK
jgi:hypothetical protein